MKEKRDILFNLKLTKSEKEYLVKKAEEEHLNLANYIRIRIFKGRK
jgi:hypothetical protein